MIKFIILWIIRSETRKFLLSALLLLLILFILFYQALLPGNILSASANIFNTPFFQNNGLQEQFHSLNPLISDEVYQFYPWRFYTWTSIRNGTLPLWNPYSYCGTPFIATMQSAVFYPINLILNLFPFESIFVISAIIRLWIAGIFTYLVCRLYRLSFIASMISAVSFMLCGYMISWLGFPHVNVAVWLPAVIYFSEKSILYSQKNGKNNNLVFLAIVIGIQFLGGHIETSADIIFSTILYYLIRVISLYHKKGWKYVLSIYISSGGIPLLLGIGLAALQLLPFLEWLPLSNEFAVKSADQFQFFDLRMIIHVMTLPLLIFPNLYNNPSWDSSYWPFLGGWSNYNENAIYIGILSFFFSILGIKQLVRGKNPIIVIWFVILIISIGRAFRIPPIDWINYLPGLDLERPERLRLVISFALSILAGVGVQEVFLSKETVISLLNTIKRFSSLTIFAGIVILIVVNLLILPVAERQFSIEGQPSIGTVHETLVNASSSITSEQDKTVEKLRDISNAFRPGNFMMYSPIIISLLFLTIFFFYKRQMIDLFLLKILVFCIIVLDLVLTGQNYNPVIKREAFYPQNETALIINRDKSLFRTVGLNFVYAPDVHLFFNFSEVSGHDFPTKWINDYFNLTGTRIPWLWYGAAFNRAEAPLLKVLNIKYVITEDPLSLDSKLTKRKVDNVWIGEATEVIPRAWVPQRVIVASDREIHQALQTISDKQVDKEIYLDENEVEFSSKTVDTAFSNVQLISYSSQQSKWRVELDQDNMLFLSDSYYPGWKAYVDGVETKIYRANIAFRAVSVPRGSHIVEFKYIPLSFTLGVITSVFSLLVLIFMWKPIKT